MPTTVDPAGIVRCVAGPANCALSAGTSTAVRQPAAAAVGSIDGSSTRSASFAGPVAAPPATNATTSSLRLSGRGPTTSVDPGEPASAPGLLRTSLVPPLI